MGYTDWRLGAKTEFPRDMAAADCATIGPKDFMMREFIVDRSFGDAVQEGVDAARVGACATSSPAHLPGPPRVSASGLGASFEERL